MTSLNAISFPFARFPLGSCKSQNQQNTTEKKKDRDSLERSRISTLPEISIPVLQLQEI